MKKWQREHGKPYAELRTNLNFYIGRKYQSMRERATRKSLPLLPINEFKLLASRSEKLQELHQAWVLSNFDRNLSPSVDRIDNKLGYIADNIQFITHSDNVKKGNFEVNRVSFLNACRRNTPVILKKDDAEMKFNSGKEACSFLGLARNAVCIAIKEGRALHGWKIEYA